MLNGEYLIVKPGYLREYATKRFNAQKNLDSAEYQDFSANRFEQAVENSRNIYGFDGVNATIKIEGPLSVDGPDIFDMFCGMGGCSYLNISDSLSRAAADVNPEQGKVFIKMNTPGGTVDGCDATFQAMWKLSQTHEVIVENMGLIASAGQWLSSAAHKVIAKTPVALSGSIGVVLNTYDFTGMLENIGIEEIIITNFESPDKIPDLKTEKGKDVVREELDAIYSVFRQRVLQGRDRALGKGVMSVEDVNAMTGRVFIAEKSLELGLLDCLEDSSSVVSDSGANRVAGRQAGKTPAFKDYPIADIEWDGDAADKRWREFTGAEDAPTSKYKNGFFWFDDKETDLFRSYKLNFVDIVDGKPHAIRRGVFAANGAMQSARGGVDIPDEDKDKVQAHIDKYRSKIEKEDEENETNESRGGKDMDLTKLLEENPTAKAQFTEAIANARAEGVQSVRAMVEKAVPFMESDTYPASIKSLALEVIKGSTDPVALTSAAAAVDAVMENKSSKEGKETTDKQPETTPDGKTGAEDKQGKVETADDYDAGVASLKQMQGMSVENAGGAS